MTEANGVRTHEGKVAIVTGAGSGIGRASAIKLAEKGAKVVVVDFNEQSGKETIEAIKDNGGEGLFVKADVSSSQDVQHYVQKTMDEYGKIDIVFNNAGIIQKFSMMSDVEDDHFDRIIDINLKGVFLGMKYALKVMEKQGFGTIINTASTTGVRAEHSLSAYTASKHGVVGLTKTAALEYVKKGIRVNAICPGGVDTAITAGVPKQFQESGYIPEELPNMRIGRFADPNELAEVVAFLASDNSSYMTGSIVLVDGGLTL
ncbi:glucose 1-dehydrogenase [Paenibacillus sp. LHD-117]|uniref:SDR family NAD(P)-dependent oxidoreductase n=1 Tax=Paenibacillus sp. LHD-117 TaxID=3071412 RepID=UPI0027E034A7|nr:glucose 1-dehydrogenase [Paenibacillus sp. LHD-117]MDQ6420647.1 glucose 1-dehydrogenase [Paenibacillus sp. LHD-117]